MPPSGQKAPNRTVVGPLPERLELTLADQIYIEKDVTFRRDFAIDYFGWLHFRILSSTRRKPCVFRPTASRALSPVRKSWICTSVCRGDAWMNFRRCWPTCTSRQIFATSVLQETPLEVAFQGQLRPEQLTAARKMLAHDTGVLSATTAFGKTVVAAWLIAERGVNTLVLVHRRQLVDQWIERLSTFLGLSRKKIGQIGGGKRKLTGRLDIAVIQSLVRKGIVKDFVGDYGHIVVDECHHLSARSFELVARRAKAKYVTGLSATVTRKDGHHPIIFMQCGPVRYRVDAKAAAAGATIRTYGPCPSHIVPSRDRG